MWEYLIGYGPAGQDSAAPWIVEEREWPARAAMEADLAAEGWEVLELADQRPGVLRAVFRRPAEAAAADVPRHLAPCW